MPKKVKENSCEIVVLLDFDVAIKCDKVGFKGIYKQDAGFSSNYSDLFCKKTNLKNFSTLTQKHL